MATPKCPPLNFEQTFVERLGLTPKKRQPRTKVHRHWWAPCDVCGEAMWINAEDFTVTWRCPICQRDSTCKTELSEVPSCTGCTRKGERHDHDETPMRSADDRAGIKCRMTPGCEGRHRKPQPQETQ